MVELVEGVAGCPKHPKYRGLRQPRKGMVNEDGTYSTCPNCHKLWVSNQDAGVRETRKRKQPEGFPYGVRPE